MIPTLLKMSDGSLDAAKEQLANMQLAQDKPHILDDDFIKRSLTLCRNQKQDSEFFLKGLLATNPPNFRQSVC